WKPHFSVPFQGYEKVLALADNDDGRGEGYEFGKMLAADIPNVKIVEMLRGRDVNSLVHESGPQKLHELVNQFTVTESSTFCLETKRSPIRTIWVLTTWHLSSG